MTQKVPLKCIRQEILPVARQWEFRSHRLQHGGTYCESIATKGGDPKAQYNLGLDQSYLSACYIIPTKDCVQNLDLIMDSVVSANQILCHDPTPRK